MPVSPPINSVPGSQTFLEDGVLVFSADNENAISINAGEATTAVVVLSVDIGDLSVDTLSGVTVTGNDSNHLTLSGMVSTINAMLDGLTYTPSANDFGAHNLSITTVANGVDVDAVAINITAVNDSPVIYGATEVSFNEGATYTFNATNMSTFSIDDVENDAVSVVLVVDSGSLDVNEMAGATVTGDESNIVIVSGSVTNVNAALDGMVFTPSDSDFYGNVTLSMSVTDAGSPAGFDTQVTTITVNNVNDAPTLNNSTGPDVDEGDSAVITGSMLDYNDIDDDDESLTYTVVSTVTHGALYLNEETIGAGAHFTQADIEYGNLSYEHDGSETSVDGFYYTLKDASNAYPSGMDTLNGTLFDISILPVNDAPTLTAQSTIEYTENDGPVVLDSGITVTDPDSSNMSSASVSIYGYVMGQDTLFADTSGTSISASFTAGVLTLTGTDTTANYQTVLRTVTYLNNSEDPNTDDRTITFTITDSASGVDTVESTLTITAVNDAPVKTGDEEFTVNQGEEYVLTTSDIYGYDVDNADEDLLFTMTSISHGTVTVSSSEPQTFPLQNNIGVTFTLQDLLDGNVVYTQDNVYGNTSDQIGFTLSDGEDTVGVLVDVTINTKPEIDANDTVGYTEQGNPITLSSMLSLDDADGDTISSAVVAVYDADNNYLPLFVDTDTLAYGGMLPGGISATIVGGEVHFSGNASLADYQSALETVTYENSSDNPSANRYVTFSVTDINGQIGEDTVNVIITQVNDAPTLETNNTLYVDEGHSAFISSSDLDIIDPDNSKDELVFTIGSGPIYGSLVLYDEELFPNVNMIGYGGDTLSGNDTFTEADIYNGRLVYVNDGSEVTADSFTFTISDGEDSIGTSTFDISINPVNDLTELNIGEDSFSTKQNTLVDLSDNISISDADDDYFGVTLTGAHGTLTIDNDTIYGSIGTLPGGGLTTGDGLNDTVIAAYGNIDYINHILDTLSFTPTNGFSGAASIEITVDDADDDVDQVSDTIDIRVKPPGSATGGPVTPPPAIDTISVNHDVTVPGGVTTVILTGTDDLIITGNSQSNLVIGNSGSSYISGLDGADTIVSSGGADTVFGNTGQDILYGNTGNDVIFGGQDNDYVFGGQNDDLMYGNQGSDTMYGGAGIDTLYGGAGDDLLISSEGDQLFGNLGNDTIYSQSGHSTATGGQGNDTYLFAGGQLTITDFVIGTDSLISTFGGTFVDDGQGNAVATSGENSITLIGISADSANTLSGFHA